MKRVFVDSGGFFALLTQEDALHNFRAYGRFTIL